MRGTGVIYHVLLPLSALPPQALNLDKWVGLALGVICHPITPDPRPAAQAHILNTGAGGNPQPRCQGLWSLEQPGRKERGNKGLLSTCFLACSFLIFLSSPQSCPSLHGTSSLPPFIPRVACLMTMRPHGMAPSGRGHGRAVMEA